MKKISIIVSVYNEESALRQFYGESKPIFDALPWDYELLFVNDGSSDGSLAILQEFAAQDPKVKLVNFSRNFGHEAAMIAGIDHFDGDGLVCMDADLQHPPECVAQIIEKFEEGYEVINMVRTKNKSAGLIKNITSGGFYKVINTISDVKLEPNASDFFAMTANAADVLKQSYREKVRFLRGYVQNIGFNRTNIEYEARARVAGESKYSLKKLFKFCIFVGMMGVLLMIYTIYGRMVHGAPSGYATIVVVMCFMFAMLFVIVGIIGEYIAIIFTELKDRPIYIVKETANIEEK